MVRACGACVCVCVRASRPRVVGCVRLAVCPFRPRVVVRGVWVAVGPPVFVCVCVGWLVGRPWGGADRNFEEPVEQWECQTGEALLLEGVGRGLELCVCGLEGECVIVCSCGLILWKCVLGLVLLGRSSVQA